MGRTTRKAIWFLGAASGIVAACSAFSGSDSNAPPVTNPNPSTDGGGGTGEEDGQVGSTDATPPMPTTDAGGPAASDAAAFDSGVLKNGSFELGCTYWHVVDPNDAGTAVVDSRANSGARSCQACGSGPGWYLLQEANVMYAKGSAFSGQASVHRAAPGNAVPMTLKINASPPLQQGATASFTPDGNWKTVKVSLVADKDHYVVSLNATGTAAGCLLIDDASLFELP